MAMISCSEFGCEINDKSLACPSCGEPSVGTQAQAAKGKRIAQNHINKAVRCSNSKDIILMLILLVVTGLPFI